MSMLIDPEPKDRALQREGQQAVGMEALEPALPAATEQMIRMDTLETVGRSDDSWRRSFASAARSDLLDTLDVSAAVAELPRIETT